MILQDVTLRYVRCDPERPNRKYQPTRPTWEVQILTRSKAQSDDWKSKGIRVKVNVDNDGLPFFTANLKRQVFKKNGERNNPPSVVNGNLEPINPNTVGNDSVGNVMVYTYQTKNPETGQELTAAQLTSIQVTTHVLREPPAARDFESFEPTETTVINPVVEEDSGEDNEETTEVPSAPVDL
jgi:hypothetical protein